MNPIKAFFTKTPTPYIMDEYEAIKYIFNEGNKTGYLPPFPKKRIGNFTYTRTDLSRNPYLQYHFVLADLPESAVKWAIYYCREALFKSKPWLRLSKARKEFMEKAYPLLTKTFTDQEQAQWVAKRRAALAEGEFVPDAEADDYRAWRRHCQRICAKGESISLEICRTYWDDVISFRELLIEVFQSEREKAEITALESPFGLHPFQNPVPLIWQRVIMLILHINTGQKACEDQGQTPFSLFSEVFEVYEGWTPPAPVPRIVPEEPAPKPQPDLSQQLDDGLADARALHPALRSR